MIDEVIFGKTSIFHKGKRRREDSSQASGPG